jgi:hypothetical protein
MSSQEEATICRSDERAPSRERAESTCHIRKVELRERAESTCHIRKVELRERAESSYERAPSEVRRRRDAMEAAISEISSWRYHLGDIISEMLWKPRSRRYHLGDIISEISSRRCYGSRGLDAQRLIWSTRAS